MCNDVRFRQELLETANSIVFAMKISAIRDISKLRNLFHCLSGKIRYIQIKAKTKNKILDQKKPKC